MATTKIRLVQGDTAPQLQLSLTDQRTRQAIDLSTPGTTARMLFREVGADAVKDTMPCFPIAGYVDPESGEVDFRPPYDVAGRGGRLAMDWSETALDTAGEFEGEVEVIFPDGRIQTAFAILKFQVREQF
ncbi:hypothetical protein [Achromobacter sp.]|uniref:hypothetical protein n=1 Tax=Achromobacter sp. TaxID=134375 RepID=UPI0028B1A307|nr:hypothetical protein [Achromobacter sp.]